MKRFVIITGIGTLLCALAAAQMRRLRFNAEQPKSFSYTLPLPDDALETVLRIAAGRKHGLDRVPVKELL